MRKFKHTHNCYLCLWEEGTTLFYKFVINANDKTKRELYERENKGEFKLQKILANEH